jgi:hypothetical protein
MEVQSSYLELLVGRIEEVDGEAIATHFLAPFGFPIFPQRSLYVRREQRDHRRQMTHEGDPIPLVWKSVLLGYLRVWLGWATFTSPFWMMWGETVDFSRPEWLVTAGLFAAWIFVLLVPGRLSAKGRAERQALYRATGSYLDPRRLGDFELESRTEDLERDLAQRGLPTEPAALLERARSADEPDARAIYAYARYAAAHTNDAAFASIADVAWARFGAP